MPATREIFVCCLVICAVILTGCTDNPSAPAGETGSVRVLSSPPGAEVYLDGEYRGTTPATIHAVTAGSHQLELRAEGFAQWISPVSVNPGSTANISAMLAAIPITALPVTYATAPSPPVSSGTPDIHIDGYWTYLEGAGRGTENPVALLIHADCFNVGDADARIVTASANLYYGGRKICWKPVYFGTVATGGHVTTDTMVSCPLPSEFKSSELAIRFENVVVSLEYP